MSAHAHTSKRAYAGVSQLYFQRIHKGQVVPGAGLIIANGSCLREGIHGHVDTQMMVLLPFRSPPWTIALETGMCNILDSLTSFSVRRY